MAPSKRAQMQLSPHIRVSLISSIAIIALFIAF